MIGPLPEGAGAYRWWYLDGLSHDGRDALVVIFFWGAVFSPYYARRLARGERPHPRDHVGVHAVLYRAGKRVGWLLAERQGDFARHEALDGSETVTIGRSRFELRAAPAPLGAGALARGGLGPSDLVVRAQLDDRNLLPMRGEVELRAVEPPLAASPLSLAPGSPGEFHRWWPRLPRGELEADFRTPHFRLSGLGYHDTNWGPEPLGRTLSGWHWSRAHLFGGGTEISYRVTDRQGGRHVHRLATGADPRCAAGGAEGGLRSSGWGIDLPPAGAVIESTPFYARYLLQRRGGVGLGETLDLRRLDLPVVRHLLRYRTWKHATHAAPGAEPGAALEGGAT